MNQNAAGKLNIVAAIGLALGGVFGMAGTMVSQPSLQNTLWAIDSLGLVMATALLTLKYFAIGESVILSGTAAGLAGSVPAFAAGSGLWATALLLISIPSEFAVVVRLIGVASAILFGLTATRIFRGEQLSPISSPLPFFAYPLLVLTFAGWIWTLLKRPA
jgi:hypothetical protein